MDNPKTPPCEKCVFMEERTPEGHLILSQCMGCGLPALSMMTNLEQTIALYESRAQANAPPRWSYELVEKTEVWIQQDNGRRHLSSMPAGLKLIAIEDYHRDVAAAPARQIQEITVWANQTFGPCRIPIQRDRAWKEMTELSAAIERNDSAEKIAEEAADVIICLARILGELKRPWAVDAKMRINRSRKWDVAPDGTGQHRKEG